MIVGNLGDLNHLFEAAQKKEEENKMTILLEDAKKKILAYIDKNRDQIQLLPFTDEDREMVSQGFIIKKFKINKLEITRGIKFGNFYTRPSRPTGIHIGEIPNELVKTADDIYYIINGKSYDYVDGLNEIWDYIMIAIEDLSLFVEHNNFIQLLKEIEE